MAIICLTTSSISPVFILILAATATGLVGCITAGGLNVGGTVYSGLLTSTGEGLLLFSIVLGDAADVGGLSVGLAKIRND